MIAIQVLALLPPATVAAVQDGMSKLLLLTTALIVVLIWELLFTLLCTGAVNIHGLTVARILSVFMPGDLPLWQLAVGALFGSGAWRTDFR